MIPSLRKLALRLDAAWQQEGFRIAAFPKVAARLLTDQRPDRDYQLTSLAEWVLGSKTYPQSCNPFGATGPPAFTVWANGRFFVNVYAYMTPEVVIHDHNFAGAFVNVAGKTIHCTWSFSDSESIDPSVRIGALSVNHVETIEEGTVREIEPGAGFIHQVWHLSRPTVVIVIRTPGLPPRSLRQFEYFRPAVATETIRDATFAPRAPQRFQYARKMMQCLRGSPEGVHFLARLVERERPWDAVWHLVENWRLLQDSAALPDVIRRGARRHGQWFHSMESVAMRANLFYGIEWRRVTAERDRIVLAFLLTFESWPAISTALQSVFPDAPPIKVVVDSLGQLAKQRIIPLGLDDERCAMLHCMLASHGNNGEWKTLVRQSFDIGGRAGWAAARQAKNSLEGEPLLMPLLKRG